MSQLLARLVVARSSTTREEDPRSKASESVWQDNRGYPDSIVSSLSWIDYIHSSTNIVSQTNSNKKQTNNVTINRLACSRWCVRLIPGNYTILLISEMRHLDTRYGVCCCILVVPRYFVMEVQELQSKEPSIQKLDSDTRILIWRIIIFYQYQILYKYVKIN